MGKKSIADQLLETLSAAGVESIYGITGDSLNAVTASLRDHKSLRWVHVRHEEAGAFAAGAEAALTGRLTVCAGSCGPGNMHLINGLYDCHRSRVPVLAIASQISTTEIGTNYHQETDPKHLFAQCSHYCESVNDPDQMPRILEIAIQTAITKRGVSVIVLPGNVARAEAPHPTRVEFRRSESEVVPGDAEVRAVVGLVDEAKRVTILAGAGCAKAHDEVVQLAAKVKAPVVHALRGKEFLEYDNPYDVGLTGLIGFSSGYHAMMECDLLLMVGTDFPYRAFYPKEAKVVQIDTRGEQLGRRARLDYGVVGDAKATLRALIGKVDEKTDDRFLRKAVAHYKKVREGLDDLATKGHDPKQIHPQYLARTIDELAAENAIFTCDVGSPTVWAARYLTMNGKRRLLGSFNHGSMANAMPQAIGAQVAYPGRQVVSLSGDGGFSMLMGDLLTLKQMDLPVKVVIFKNDSLGFVELEMKVEGLIDYGTDLVNPDFAKIAEGAGVGAFSVKTADEVRPVLEEAFAYPGPALIEVPVTRQELIMPPEITVQQAKGFGMYMVKAVLNGKGNEVVELAKENLFR